MKKLKINILDPDSIQRAINELDYYKEWVPATADALLYRIAQMAADIAQKTYDDPRVAWFEGWTRIARGDPHVRVTVETRKGDTPGYAIVADGEEVCFIEFGSGLYANAVDSPVYLYAYTQGVVAVPGMWSAYHAGTYQNWLNNHGGSGVGYYYNFHPQPAMLKAYEAIIRELPGMIKEMFNYKGMK